LNKLSIYRWLIVTCALLTAGPLMAHLLPDDDLALVAAEARI